MSNPRIAEASLRAGTRFPVNRKDHTKKGPYFKPAFERLLKMKYPVKLPTGELAKMQGYPGVAIAVIGEALKGDVIAAREVMDRVDGKVVDKVEHSGVAQQIVIVHPPQRQKDYAERLKTNI